MGIANDLREENVTVMDLAEYVRIESGTTVRDTVGQMKAAGVNCAFVVKENRLVGIFTDRDVLRSVVDRPDLWNCQIDEVMTHHPRTIHAGQTAGDALSMMNEMHFRNTPVINDAGEILGNLTYGSLVRYMADHFQEAVINLPPEPDQFGEERYGG